MKPELIVLDMAGTTVYDGDAVNRCLAEALHAAEVQVTRDEVNLVMGITKPTAIRMLMEEKLSDAAAITTERVMQIHADFQARMLNYYRTSPEVRPTEGAEEALRTLKATGIKLALDTGFDRPIADAILERLGWKSGLLDTTVTSDEVERGRPYPDLILRAMELTGVSDASVVAKVGDTPSDLKQGTAAACGWVIGVTSGSHTQEELEPHPHTHLIHGVADLPALLLSD